VYCVLKRKVTKCDFCLKTTPFVGKNVRERKSVVLDQSMLFSRRYTDFLESEEFYKFQIRFPRTFLPH
jgi:hypothetical protein